MKARLLISLWACGCQRLLNWFNLAVALGSGLGDAIAVLPMGDRSLIYFNSAVTPALTVKRVFYWQKVFPYNVIQASGALFGAAAVRFM